MSDDLADFTFLLNQAAVDDDARERLELVSLREAAEAAGYLVCPTGHDASTNAACRTDKDKDKDDSPPTTIGRYEIRRRLGKGGLGSVYLAYDPQLERQVAVKIPNRELFDRGIGVESFVQEARSAARIESPALVSVHDVQLENGQPYIVQQYIEGCSFDEWLRQNPPSCETTVSKLIEIAEAVGILHQHGIFHRDLKPGNILVDHPGQIYIADFGLALHEHARLTHIGQIAGTPAYPSY